MKNKRKYHDEEWRLQAHIFRWARLNSRSYPELELLAGSMNGVKMTAGQASKAKRTGMLKGWPDIQLPVAREPYIGLFIELKTERGRTSDEQKKMLIALSGHGHFACVCRGADAAIDIIQKYLKGEL